jgi:microcompartment protein CcmK/EutM
MSGVAKRRLQAVSQQLVEGITDAGKFEDIPRIRTVAPDSVGPRVKDKVVIVTGKPELHHPSSTNSPWEKEEY